MCLYKSLWVSCSKDLCRVVTIKFGPRWLCPNSSNYYFGCLPHSNLLDISMTSLHDSIPPWWNMYNTGSLLDTPFLHESLEYPAAEYSVFIYNEHMWQAPFTDYRLSPRDGWLSLLSLSLPLLSTPIQRISDSLIELMTPNLPWFLYRKSPQSTFQCSPICLL